MKRYDIYIVKHKDNSIKKCYIGKTREGIKTRCYKEKSNFKHKKGSTSCKILFEEFGYDNIEYKLLSCIIGNPEHPEWNELEWIQKARGEEQYWIDEYKDVCVNKQAASIVPFNSGNNLPLNEIRVQRTEEEKREQRRTIVEA